MLFVIEVVLLCCSLLILFLFLLSFSMNLHMQRWRGMDE